MNLIPVLVLGAIIAAILAYLIATYKTWKDTHNQNVSKSTKQRILLSHLTFGLKKPTV